MNQAIEVAEKIIFERFAARRSNNPTPMLFIVASPRTGSTPFYQMVIEVFGFSYFSNFVSDNFSKQPAVGMAIELQANPHEPSNFSSNYGKTAGLFGPSEASLIFKNWFGGRHPSQTESSTILPAKRMHMELSLHAVHEITGRPLVTKNAWNCFRLQDLYRIFPGIRFLWFRRDVVHSSVSDLESRYHRGSPETWNSATTRNYKEIQKRPYWEQVVEQQFEYNRTLKNDLRKYCPDGFLELWYEDMCSDTNAMVKKLTNTFSGWGWKIKPKYQNIHQFKSSSGPSGMNQDIHKIEAYVAENTSRLGPYFYKR